MVQAPKHNRFFFLLVVFAFLVLAASSMKAFAADVETYPDTEPEQTAVEETVSDNDIVEEQVITDETIGSAEAEPEQPIDNDSVPEEEIPVEEVPVEQVPAVDYTEQLDSIMLLLEYITGIMIFFVVVVLCKYVYSFFNIFF